ncbi:MAG: hypothetical protein AAF597_18920, partial [Bacteroidota bacterium]
DEDANGGNTLSSAGSAYIFGRAANSTVVSVNENTNETPDDLGTTVNITTSTVAQEFTITNDGALAATGVSVTLGGTAGFSLLPGLSSTTVGDNGGTATFTVLFTPSVATGTFTETITVSHDEGDDVVFTVSVIVNEATVFVNGANNGFASIAEALQAIANLPNGSPTPTLFLSEGTFTEALDLTSIGGNAVKIEIGAPPALPD